MSTVPAVSPPRCNVDGVGIEHLWQNIRDVVRDELRKLLPASNRLASLSIAELVREEVQRACQPDTPNIVPSTEELALSYAAMARRHTPVAPQPRREPSAPRQAGHIYRRCPYRQLGLRGFHPNDPRPRYDERPPDNEEYLRRSPSPVSSLRRETRFPITTTLSVPSATTPPREPLLLWLIHLVSLWPSLGHLSLLSGIVRYRRTLVTSSLQNFSITVEPFEDSKLLVAREAQVMHPDARYAAEDRLSRQRQAFHPPPPNKQCLLASDAAGPVENGRAPAACPSSRITPTEEALHRRSRRRDLHILTVGTCTYTSDQRFHSIHLESSEDWTLEVRYTQKWDGDVYKCQVSTEPKMSLNISLAVV
ncbi:hypothetical protein HPB47_004658, partial [Ixodes persulcatus]